MLPSGHAFPPARLNTTVFSLKRLCLDVLISNPNINVGSSLSHDVKELLLHRAMFGSCLLQQQAEKIEPVTVDLLACVRSADAAWVDFVGGFFSRYLGAHLRTCEHWTVKVLAFFLQLNPFLFHALVVGGVDESASRLGKREICRKAHH